MPQPDELKQATSEAVLRELLFDADHRSQAFWAKLAREISGPNFGGKEAEYVRSLLLRAEEAKLYTPEAK